MPKARKTFKETVEQNPITSIVLVASATVASTFGVMTYFHQTEDKLRELESARQLAVHSEESEKKIGYLEGRLASIERKVGAAGASYLDVTSLLATPDTIRGLDKNFTYFNDLNCYIAIPATEQWTHEVTNEMRLAQMLTGAKDDLAKDSPLFQAAAESKLHLWKGPVGYDVNTGDDDVPILHLFPFVVVQSFENSQMAALIGKAVVAQSESNDARLNELKESMNRLTASLKNDIDRLKDKKVDSITATEQSAVSVPDSAALSKPTVTGHEAEKLEATEMLERVFRSDFAGFVLFSQLAMLQQFQQMSKECTVHLVSAEKKGNVLYCNFNITIVDSKTKLPIYWDREVFFVSGTRRSYIVATSAPSTDRRSVSAAWITTWLSSLRVPLE